MMSAEPYHGNLSIRGLHINHRRARELMGSSNSTEPLFEILTSGVPTCTSPNIIYECFRERDSKGDRTSPRSGRNGVPDQQLPIQK
jgi:hypothetical protein